MPAFYFKVCAPTARPEYKRVISESLITAFEQMRRDYPCHRIGAISKEDFDRPRYNVQFRRESNHGK